MFLDGRGLAPCSGAPSPAVSPTAPATLTGGTAVPPVGTFVQIGAGAVLPVGTVLIGAGVLPAAGADRCAAVHTGEQRTGSGSGVLTGIIGEAGPSSPREGGKTPDFATVGRDGGVFGGGLWRGRCGGCAARRKKQETEKQSKRFFLHDFPFPL